MAELFTEVIAVLKGDSSSAILSEEFGVASPESAGNAAALSVPIVMLNLGRWANDLTMSYRLFELIRSYDPQTMTDQQTLLEAGLYNSRNNDLLNDLLEERRQIVGDRLAVKAGVNKQSSQGILAASAGLVLASIARRHGSEIDRMTLLGLLEQERQSLVAAGWQPWLDTVDAAAGELAVTAREPLPTKPIPVSPAAPPVTPAIRTYGSATLAETAPVGDGIAPPVSAYDMGGVQARSSMPAVEGYSETPAAAEGLRLQEEQWAESKSVALRALVVFLAALAIGLGCYIVFNEDGPASDTESGSTIGVLAPDATI